MVPFFILLIVCTSLTIRDRIYRAIRQQKIVGGLDMPDHAIVAGVPARVTRNYRLAVPY
jgi:acetyltransferase-like isoleucine patch superfamily enzyme